MHRRSHSKPVSAPSLALAALLLLVGGCGPRYNEIGVAVLLAAPLVYLTTHVLLYFLSLLWRRRYVGLRHPIKLWLIVPAVALAVIAPLIGPSNKLDLSIMAYWVFGTSHLTVTLVIWRVWFIFNEELSFTHAQAPAALLSSALALACVLEVRSLRSVALLSFMIPGYGGLISGPLYLALIIEAALRGRAPQPARRAA